MARMEFSKRPQRAFCKGHTQVSGEHSFEIEEDALEIGRIDDLLELCSAQEEGATTDIVDLTGNALGMVVDGGDKTVAEDGFLEASDTQVVFDVARGLFQIEGFDVVADGDSLGEGLIGGKTKLVGQLGLAKQDEGKGRRGVDLVVKHKAELIEDFRWEEVGFVHGEEDIVALTGQIGQGGAELGQKAKETEGGLDLQGQEDLAVEGRDGKMRVSQVNDAIEILVQ